MFFSKVGELKFQRINNERIEVFDSLCQVHEIPAKQEEEEGWYTLSIIFVTLTVVEASSLMT